MYEPTEVAAAIAALDAIEGTDPEAAHAVADAVARTLLPAEVQEAYTRVKERCRWWAFA